MGNKDSNSHSRGWYHHSALEGRIEAIWGMGRTWSRVGEGLSRKKRDWEGKDPCICRSHNTSKQLSHWLCWQSHAGNEERSLGGCQRGFEREWTDQHLRWSGGAASIFASIYTLCTCCKRKKTSRACTMFSKEIQTYHSQNSLG